MLCEFGILIFALCMEALYFSYCLCLQRFIAVSQGVDHCVSTDRQSSTRRTYFPAPVYSDSLQSEGVGGEGLPLREGESLAGVSLSLSDLNLASKNAQRFGTCAQNDMQDNTWSQVML